MPEISSQQFNARAHDARMARGDARFDAHHKATGGIAYSAAIGIAGARGNAAKSQQVYSDARRAVRNGTA